jgi:glycosyltransferase involved in cell wall biosynthesis
MQILFVSPRQCWPAVSGAKLREFHLCKALGGRVPLHYVFFSAPQGPPPAAADLPFCQAITAVPPVRPYSPGKLIRGVLGAAPVSVLNYTTPAMVDALRTIAPSAPFDLVHLDSIHLAAFEPLLRGLLPRARIVYDWHNIESDLLFQYVSHAPSRAKKLYSALTARKMAALELRTLHSAFGHIVCSARERAELAALAPAARIEVIENGVDASRFPAAPRPCASRNRIVFVGLLNNQANMKAVIWFTRNIWPAVRRRFPQWKLTLVGTDPAPSVFALAREPNVEVTGTVPDVAPYYEQAIAAVVPLLSGSGTRLKILEAMAAGVPVVSTPIGAEGLDVSEGNNILLAPGGGSGPDKQYLDQWIAALESLAPQGALWLNLANAGRTFVESRYNWDVIGAKLFDTYSRWLSEKA